MLPEKGTTCILVTKGDYEFLEMERERLLGEMNRTAHVLTKASVKIVIVVHDCEPYTWERKAGISQV